MANNINISMTQDAKKFSFTKPFRYIICILLCALSIFLSTFCLLTQHYRQTRLFRDFILFPETISITTMKR